MALSIGLLCGVAAAQPCVSPPAGLAAWWPAEGGAGDAIGTNAGIALGGVSYASGKIGQAFSFSGASGNCVRIPYAALLGSSTYTLEAWINPMVQIIDPIGQKVLIGQNVGRAQLVAKPGTTGAKIVFQFNASGSWQSVQSLNEIPLNQFTHVVATWDGATQRLYINGVLSAHGAAAAPTDSGCDFFIGGIQSTAGGAACQYSGQFFQGLIDEASYYQRALSDSEIQGLYNAGAGGKCLGPPIIVAQPANQTVTLGGNAAFSVGATGFAPLSYQWSFNGTNVEGASSTSLTLTNVQTGQGGVYVVVVTNAYGSLRSSNALLTVNPPATNASPSGLISLWSGDGSAEDSPGGNNGTALGGAAYLAGQHEQAFLFNGAVGNCIRIPYAANLSTPNYTVSAWVKPLAQISGGINQVALFAQNSGRVQLVAQSGTTGVRVTFQFNSPANWQILQSQGEIPIGQFSHVAATWDGTTERLYLNGVLSAQRVASAAPGDSGCDFFIGGINSTAGGAGCQYSGQFFQGLVDEVSYYGRALSAPEILGAFQGQLPPLNVSLTGTFGRVPLGQSKTNDIVFTNLGTNDLAVAPLQLSGGTSAFQILQPAGGFILHPGQANAVTARVRFAPDAPESFNAILTGVCAANSVQVPLTGLGLNTRTFALDLQKRTPGTGQINVTRQVFSGSQLAVIIMDVWNSHPDPEMAARGTALIPWMNQVLDAARSLGITIIFCPNEVALPAGANTQAFTGLPNQPGIDNGFNPPLPPYTAAGWGDMVPVAYDAAYGPRFRGWSSQHPDLVVKPGDLASTSGQQIHNYCAANGITHLIYMGAAGNMCVCYTRETSMIPMKRYHGLEPIMARDLTDSMTLNGRKQTGGNNSGNNVDLTMTPDRGHAQVVAHNETYVCSSIDARQLLQYWPAAAYASLVAGEPSLLCCWQMDAGVSYQEILDLKRTQSCWWNRDDNNQIAGLTFGVGGAITNDPGAAVQFSGSTLLASPIYRDDIPTNSPLASLSSTNFTLELWVQPALLGSNQWFFAHDNGSAVGIDVLLGLNSNNRFQFIVGSNPNHTDIGDLVQSQVIVMPGDLAARRWFHIVAVHDVGAGMVSLYIDGSLEAQTTHACAPVRLSVAPHLGSRGSCTLGGTRYLTNRGFEFLHGSLDEVALYSSALSGETISLHHQTAQPHSAGNFALTSVRQPGQIVLRWPAWPLGYLLQTSTDLSHWEDSTLPIQETNGWRQTFMPLTNGQQFFRPRSP